MAAPPVRIVQLSFFRDPQSRPPQQLLEAWTTLVDVAEAARRAGVAVAVVQASEHTRSLLHEGIRYEFLPFGAARQPNGRLAPLLRQLAPQVLHVHGLDFPRQVQGLAALCPRVPIVLQDHASKLPRLWRRPAWRRGLAAADAIAFCARAQARPFIEAGLILRTAQLYEIPESTSRFCPGEQAAARRLTGVEGEPALLWVGHLDANKDPLTVLDAVSLAAAGLPRLRLYCCYASAPLMQAVHARIASDPLLRGRVHLLGRVPHQHIEQLMRAADLFVLGSHREGSGYALIEALACGLPPLVTDIASFRALTGDGRVGMLWPCNDAQALSAALSAASAHLGPRARLAVRAHFERELSFDALGRKLAALYAQLIERRGEAARATHRAASAVPVPR
jgi:glycosyltransferase involved in cell wall biosynthesis